MYLRKYLNQTGLLLEGVENLKIKSTANVYCGFNVSKTENEPIDQIQSFIIAKKIQNWNKEQFQDPGLFIAFIGGVFEIFNSKNTQDIAKVVKDNIQKEEKKKVLFTKICKRFKLNCLILTTQDLWMDQEYWLIIKSLFDNQTFTRGALINDTLKFYENKSQLLSTLKVKDLPKEFVNFPLEFIKKIGNFPSSILYTPAEVAEAIYLSRKFSINTKIGQCQERIYDKYLYSDFNVFRMRQPTSLISTKQKNKAVTPYIDKDINSLSGTGKIVNRLYFNDSYKETLQKINLVNDEEYVFTMDEKYGEVLNPIVEKTIFCIETRKETKNKLTLIKNQLFGSGEEVIQAILENKLTIKDLKQELAKLIKII